MEGTQELDSAMRQALVDPEDGLLRPGALPKVATATSCGSKALMDAIEKAWNAVCQKSHKGLSVAPIMC